MTDKTREEFEAYLRSNGHPENKLKRLENGDYDFASTALYWKQWQHQQQKIADLENSTFCGDEALRFAKEVIADLERQLADTMHDKDMIEKLEREVERIPELKRQNRELRELRPEVFEFARAMECKLRLNDHKGSWKDCDFSYLNRRLKEEMREMVFSVTQDNCNGLLGECADVANFAMMVADIHGVINIDKALGEVK